MTAGAEAGTERDGSGSEGSTEAVGEVVSALATIPRWWRPAALSVYAVALVVWIVEAGMPKDPFVMFAILWLASVAWYAGHPWRQHAQFFKDWWPAFAALVLYMYSRGLSDELIGMPVHWVMPIEVDRWMFGGRLPTEVLQERLCGDPCRSASDPRWFDLVFTSVYNTHFVLGLGLALVLYLRNRREWISWLTRYVAINVTGLVVYVFYPMAPPWLAGQEGYLDPVARLTGRGWRDIGLGGFHHALAAVGNPVAAMPSLHAGVAMLVTIYAVSRLRGRRWRWVLMLYPLTMAFALVYYGEHYVIDAIAGWALALVVHVGVTLWERRYFARHPVTTRSGALLSLPPPGLGDPTGTAGTADELPGPVRRG